MYGKIFDSIFNSTLAATGGWLPTYIFMSMISLADKDGYVEIDPRALFHRLGFRDYDCSVSYQDFESAVKYLMSEDTFSKSTSHNGKRIIPLSELQKVDGQRGYWIVNYLKYRQLGSREDKNKRDRDRIAKQRKELKNNSVAECSGVSQNVADVAHTDTDTDKKKYIKKKVKRKHFTAPSLEDIKAYAEERNSQVDPKFFFDYFEANDWKDSHGNKVKSWKQKFIVWSRREQPSEKSQEYKIHNAI